MMYPDVKFHVVSVLCVSVCGSECAPTSHVITCRDRYGNEGRAVASGASYGPGDLRRAWEDLQAALEARPPIEVTPDEIAALRAGKYTAAIQAVRLRSRCSLREAKAAVDAYRAEVPS